MVPRVELFFTLIIVSTFLIVSMDARSWDLAVTIGRQIDFFYRNGTEINSVEIPTANSLRDLAYDNKTKTMYISDTVGTDVSIYTKNMSENGSKTEVFKKSSNGNHLEVIAFDPVTRNLFWIDTSQELLMRMNVDQNASDATILHDLKGKIPWGLAVDICNGYIYWANSNSLIHSIERSKLDGTERRVVVEENLYEPHALAIDYEDGKLYWTNLDRGYQYTIGRSNLDGTESEILHSDMSHQPLYLAVDKESVYWSDRNTRAIWKFDKKNDHEEKMRFRSYHESHPEDRITSIITWDSVEDIDCKALSEKQRNRLENKILPPAPQPSSVEPHDNLTTNTKELNSTTEAAINCLNEGIYDQKTASCRCKKGFTGSQCEVTVVCNGYYLNNGTCIVSTSVADQPATSSNYTNGCNQGMERISEHGIQDTEPEISYYTTMGFLVPMIIIGVLLIVIGVLSFHIHKLRRRPRIKRRFGVNKGGVTSLTTRPEVPADGYEITIENCCNMNICETPCFEPKLRTPPPKTNSTKREEKNSLLDSMEGADSC